MGRMLKRALVFEPDPLTDLDKRRIERLFKDECIKADSGGQIILTFNRESVNWRSLNTTGVQFRVRQLQWGCIRFRKGLGELYTPEEQNAHLAKPVTKKDILDGYLRAGHYFNNFKPRV